MNDLYIPPSAVCLDKADANFQRRLMLSGFPKTGKTFAALSFKNPIVLSFDRGLVAHIGRTDVHEVPFYDDTFVDSLEKKPSPMYPDVRTGLNMTRPSNRKDALLKWLYKEAPKLSKEQTLVVDGNTAIQAAFHTQYWTSPALDKSSQVKPYEEYARKVSYFTELMMCFKALQCDVVYLCHESADRNDKGDLNGKIRPLMSGKFLDELQSHFTDCFRAITVEKPTPDKQADFVKKWGIDTASLTEWIKSTPDNVRTIFLWQTQSDNIVECGTSLFNAPKYILANAESFDKYRTKFPVTNGNAAQSSPV